MNQIDRFEKSFARPGESGLTESIEISVVSRPVIGSIRPPGSKSITNRALICAAIASGRSVLSGALDSEDTRVMITALRQLGVGIEAQKGGANLIVDGAGDEWDSGHRKLFLANSGTSIRFLTALAAFIPGITTLDGIARMRQRPIGDLVDALRLLGAEVGYGKLDGFPPVDVRGGERTGGEISIRGDISSQYLSALMMAAPLAKSDLLLRVEGTLISRPYVEMTRQVMQDFGARCEIEGDFERIHVGSSLPYLGREYAIEPDASAASYFWAAAAITQGDVTVSGLSPTALQGDVGFCDCLAKMGCRVESTADSIRVIGGELQGIDVEMSNISDTVQTLAAVALFASGPTRIRGVAHNRHKETDRIGDLATELRRLGAEVNEFEDGLEIKPSELNGCEMETYNDHRMAMSLALVGLMVPGVVILNPQCTEKTYPDFFVDMRQLVESA